MIQMMTWSHISSSCWSSSLLILLLVVGRFSSPSSDRTNSADAFSIQNPPSHHHQRLDSWSSSALSAFKTSIEEIEQDLTDAEKSVTSVVRKCGPSVAFVTSIMPSQSIPGQQSPTRRRQRRNSDSRGSGKNNLPRGQSLGSGSGFVVDVDGYVATNYHVIEQAYRLTQVANSLNSTLANVTQSCSIVGSLLNETLQIDAESLPRVFVRIESDKNYQECRIVEVYPELDLAVLKIEHSNSKNQNTTSLSYPFIEFGSSSRLIVGQSVVAIGNP